MPSNQVACERIPAADEQIRGLRDVGPPDDRKAAFESVAAPIDIIAGADDELMKVDEYAKVAGADAGRARVTIVPGADHLGVLREPAALAAVGR